MVLLFTYCLFTYDIRIDKLTRQVKASGINPLRPESVSAVGHVDEPGLY